MHLSRFITIATCALIFKPIDLLHFSYCHIHIPLVAYRYPLCRTPSAAASACRPVWTVQKSGSTVRVERMDERVHVGLFISPLLCSKVEPARRILLARWCLPVLRKCDMSPTFIGAYLLLSDVVCPAAAVFPVRVSASVPGFGASQLSGRSAYQS